MIRDRYTPSVISRLPGDGGESAEFDDPWPSPAELARDAADQSAQDAYAAEQAARLQGLMDRYNALPTLPAAGGYATTHPPFPVLAGAPPPFAHPDGPQGNHEHWTDAASGQLMHRFMHQPGVVHRGPLGGPYNQQLRDPQRGLGEFDPAYCRVLTIRGPTCIVGEHDPDDPYPGAPAWLTENPQLGGDDASLDPAWVVRLGLDLPRADRGIGFVPPLQAGVNIRWYGTPPTDLFGFGNTGVPDESIPDPRNAECPHIVRMEALNAYWTWEWRLPVRWLPRELWPDGYEPAQTAGDDLTGTRVPVTLANSYSLSNTPYGWVIRFPGETDFHAADTSPGGSAEAYWPTYWDLRYRWAAFDPWTTSFPGSQVAPYVLERDGVASGPSGSYYRVTCSDHAVTPEGLAFPATWPAPGAFSAPLGPGTQVVWWGGGTDISPDRNPRWEIRTRWTAPITPQVLRDAGCARPLLVERYSLGVVPRDVVYRREAGTAPPMPPCGRRAL